MRRSALGMAALLACVSTTPAQAQAPDSLARDSAAAVRFAVGVAPDTVTVGDPFVATVRLRVPAGSRVTFVGLPVADSLQPRDTLRAMAPAAGEATAAYPLVAWVAGVPLSARATVRVSLPGGGVRTYSVPLRLPTVRSVLPADTTGLRPRPARGVLALPGRDLPWTWMVLGAALLAAAGLALWRLRRPSPEPRRDPRAEALAELHRIAAETGGAEAAAVDRVARVLRRYLARLHGGWAESWTTAELLARMHAGGEPEPALRALRDLLQRADRVKFAAVPATRAGVDELLAGARAWVEGYPPPETAEAPREAA